MPFDESKLAFGDVSLSLKGARSCPLKGDTAWTPGELAGLRCCWEPKSFDGTDQNRVSINFASTPETEADLERLEKWVVETVSKDPKRFFDKDLTPASVKERFCSSLKVSAKGYRSIRAKMNFAGRQAVNYWTPDRQPRDAPEDWLSASLQPHLVAKGLWFMSKDWGVLLEMTDCLVDDAAAVCPF
jgi:hypothetical protein